MEIQLEIHFPVFVKNERYALEIHLGIHFCYIDTLLRRGLMTYNAGKCTENGG